ncbi:hypothetical protein [Kozakia baliensis]|uniref:hypothetical protein n=1 Tax=Kozakia baliensis TaxID=153496 RepID=UPI000495FE56|nr:hypothetical protein [Kozakia baliensis]
MKKKLGALAAVVRPGQPRLSGLRMMARKAPPRLLRGHIDPKPLMLGNDRIGDCTAAGLGNHIRATSTLAGFKTDVRDLDAEGFYARSTGYVPGNPATDRGGVESDVLTYAARHGYALKDQTLYPIWGTVDFDDFNGMRNIMVDMGAAYLGVQLAVADQHDGVLDVTTSGDQTPGSWGGHCLLAYDYDGTEDDSLVSLITWGGLQKCTWRWLRSRLMETHAVAWHQLMPAGKATGADWERLVADNASYLAGPTA